MGRCWLSWLRVVPLAIVACESAEPAPAVDLRIDLHRAPGYRCGHPDVTTDPIYACGDIDTLTASTKARTLWTFRDDLYSARGTAVATCPQRGDLPRADGCIESPRDGLILHQHLGQHGYRPGTLIVCASASSSAAPSGRTPLASHMLTPPFTNLIARRPVCRRIVIN